MKKFRRSVSEWNSGAGHKKYLGKKEALIIARMFLNTEV